ncbi:MAG: carboxypeptidase regulatory-like domain-containing protein [Elusimicrobia bacterium]|nr:carboxypeptidase regulatory-like domain-containing protein [Elusimicrobiota bacterium]
MYYRKSPGVTLVELLVAVTILTVGIVSLVATFGGIQKAIQASKAKTVAANLVQEKMQILKQMTYYAVIVTSMPAFNNDYNPPVPYDIGYFPPETILEGGISFTRLTYIQGATENSGKIVTLPVDAPDAGMRLITVSTFWKQGGEKKLLQLSSVMANPATVMPNGAIKGTVTNSVGGAGIAGAMVVAAQDMGYQDTTASDGSYGITVSPGNYNLVASAPGFFTSIRPVGIGANQTVTQPFPLLPMSSGSVTGVAWMNTGPVISQVVVGTTQANGFVAEYVELFNPTTYPITIGGNPPSIKLNVAANCLSANVNCSDSTYGVPMSYYNVTIASGGYYVFANTRTFTAGGVTVNADAVFVDTVPALCSQFAFQNVTGMASPPNPPLPTCSAGTCNFSWNTASNPPVKLLLNPTHDGVFWLSDRAGTVIDGVGWTHGGYVPPNCEGTCITMPGTNGLEIPEQLMRFASTAGVSAVWGPAYDSSNNTVDIATAPVPFLPPHGTFSAKVPIVSGKVPVGGVISATDTLSSPMSAATVGNPPYAAFTLTPVATGFWSVYIASRGYECQLATVTIASSGSTYQFSSTTTFLNLTSTVGFVVGRVTDASGVPLPGLPVNPGGAGSTSATDSSGRYTVRATAGMIDLIANQSGDPGCNVSYISVTSVAVPVSLGVVTNNVNFMLSQGGKVTGFVTRDGSNALPGVAVALFDSNGQAHDQAVSDGNGRFTMYSATGNYTLMGEVDSMESVSPAFTVVTVLAGQTVFSATFTVTGALGYISGHVYTGASVPIRGGVLILASTATLPSPPPALSTATLTGAAIYATSSQEDGSYTVGVRQSTYTVNAYYSVVSSTGGISVVKKTAINKLVYPGQTISGVDFSW